MLRDDQISNGFVCAFQYWVDPHPLPRILKEMLPIFFKTFSTSLFTFGFGQAGRGDPPPSLLASLTIKYPFFTGPPILMILIVETPCTVQFTV